jgi:hypothetical protein
MPSKEINPYLVLAAGLLVPGSGHMLLGKPQRGLIFLFFILVLGWASYHIMPQTGSFVLRHAGGFLVYGLSALDAYKIARVRQAVASFKAE